jgi:hypothetical protein
VQDTTVEDTGGGGTAASWTPIDPVLRFVAWTERRLAGLATGRRWTWKVVVLAAAIGMFLAGPPLGSIPSDGEGLWPTVIGNSGPRLFDPSVPRVGQAGNLTFRVFPRLIGAALGFEHVWQFLLVQFLFGILLLWAAAKLFDEVLRSRVLAALLTIGTATIWGGATAWMETRGLFDGIAISLLGLAMVARRWWVALPLAIAAGFTDERAVIALPLVVCWQVMRPEQEAAEDAAAESAPSDGVDARSEAVTTPWRWRGLLRPTPLLLMSAVLIHFAIRTWLKHRYGLHENEDRYPENPFTQIRNYPNGLWGAFEGFWILVVAGVASFVHRRQWTEAVVIVIGAGASLTAGVSVVDISRAVAYAWPAVPLALLGLVGIARPAVRTLVWFAVALCVVWPMVYAAGDQTVDWYYPAPLVVLLNVPGVG